MSLDPKVRGNALHATVWAQSWVLLAAVLFSFFAALLLLTVPMFVLLIYDRVLPSRSPQTLVALMILSLGLVVLMATLDFSRRRLLARFGARLQERLEAGIGAHPSGIADSEALDGLRAFFHSSAVVSLIDVLWAPLFVFAVFVLHPMLGWTAIVGLVALAATFALGELFSHHPRAEAERHREAVAGLKEAARRSADVVAGQRLATIVEARWRSARARSRNAAIHSRDRSAGVAAIMRVVRTGFTIVLLAVSAGLVLHQQLTTGGMVATMVLLNRVFNPFLNLFGDWRSIGKARRNWRQVADQFGAAAAPASLLRQVPEGAPLVLDRVSVAGDHGAPLLRNVSLSVAPGDLVEIVGPTSSGKTLLCQTMLGLRPPRTGSVRIGDVPLAAIPAGELGRLFGYLAETPRFVAGPILEAIAGPEPDLEAAVRAARTACLHARIESLPGGYGHQIDAAGSGLSEGERVLLALARALYRRPRFLVLDAPGSSIGDAFGAALADVLAALRADGTAILVFARERQKLPVAARRLRIEKSTLVEAPRLQPVAARPLELGEPAMTRDVETVSVGRPFRLGLLALAALAALLGVWGTQTRIAGAVIAHGAIKVDGTTHLVSHETGGTVRSVMVAEGDQVRAGDVLLVFDDEVLRARLDGVENELEETVVAEARLEAEAMGHADLVVGDALAARLAASTTLATIVERHRLQLRLNRAALERSEAQQRQVMAQVREQIAGAEAELDSLERQAVLVERELERARAMLDDGIGTQNAVATLEQSQVVLQGDIGRARSACAERRERLIEIETVVPTLAETFRADALDELGRLQTIKAGLLVERAELSAQLAALVVRAPIDGTVHQSHLAGVRSVVVAGAPILSLVPTTETVTALVQVRDGDIDQVYPGQEAALQFQSFNARSMPTLSGTVLRIAADTETDAVTRRPTYKVQIRLPLDEIRALPNVDLVNGMPLVAFLATDEQTPLQYVTRPIAEYFSLAFRDTTTTPPG